MKYILGYSLTDKKEDREEKNAEYHALMAESQARADLGVGQIWKPVMGGGVRPSAILALNVVSLATADLEMQALAQANPRVKSATHHEIFTFGNDKGITDEQVLVATRQVYQRMELAGAQMVMAVHRDTEHVHVHVARSAVNPMTLRAYDRQMIHTRFDRAARHVEIAMGLFHDRGLAVVDYIGDDGQRRIVRDSTRAERVAWARESAQEREASLERVRYVDNVNREGSFARWADARVEPRLRAVLRGAKDNGEPALAIDILNKAARHGCKIQLLEDDGRQVLILRDVSTGRLRGEQRAKMAEVAERLKAEHANGLVRDEALDALKEAQVAELREEMTRLETKGEFVELSQKMHDELLEAFGDLGVLRSTLTAEEDFISAVEADVGLVTRTLTQQASTFTRETVDRFLVDRLDDAGEVERLSRKIFTEDPTLVLLSPDIADGVWTTREMLEIEQLLAIDAKKLAKTKTPFYNPDRQAAAIATMEQERSRDGEAFRLSPEQREAISHDRQLIAIKGRPGVGKTTVMEAIRREADLAGRKVHGITVAQAAAVRLSVEGGFTAVNSAFALLADGPKRQLIPRDGVLVLDEAGMIDSRTMREIMKLAVERNCTVVGLADPRQIPPVGAGGAWHILEAAAREAGSYSELIGIRRQKNEWHKTAVHLVSDAIDARSEPLFLRAVKVLEEHNSLTFTANKDEAIQQVVSWYEAERAISPDVLLVATDRDTVRYLNEELLRRKPDRGPGHDYRTDGGMRNFAVGDRFIFGENNGKIGVNNGDTGTVVEVGGIMVGVKLDRTGGVVKFDSRKYEQYDHGYATTVARAQGASVRAIGGIADSAATTEVFNVMVSRSKQVVQVYVPSSAFPDPRALAAHLASHIVAKGTTQDISLELASHGGPDSFFARNVLAQKLSASSPERQEYEADWTEMRNERDRELRDVSEHFRRLRALTNDPDEILMLRRQQRSDEAKIVQAFQPEDFGVWLYRRRQGQDPTEARMAELNRHRLLVENKTRQLVLAPEVGISR